MKYYAWSPNGDCSDGFDTLEEAEDEAHHGDYRYVVLGMPEEAVEIIMDLALEDTLKIASKDLYEIFRQLEDD